jgi:Fe-S cluster assembly protein SufD
MTQRAASSKRREGAEWLAEIREQAAQRFAQLGWPTTQLEEWKFTSLTPISRVAWRFADGPAAVDTRGASLRDRAAAELVFVNGWLIDGSASVPGISVTAISEGGDDLEEHYAQYADYQRHPLTALNTANAQDGGLIVVPDGAIVDGFIHLLFIGEGDGIWSHPRNLFVVGRNAQVNVVETFVGRGAYFTNVVTEIVAGEGAVVDHTRFECESIDAFHVGTVQVHQERSSNVTTRSFAIGGAIVRSEVNAALAGEGAGITLDGLFVLTGSQHVDNHTVIDHIRPHCDSLELYKGILDQKSRGVFDGTIIVRPDAQKTNSRQVNRNLLLSENAIIDSKPTLEILNDDVKCSHGSTIGQIDEEALFYMRSRGIGETQARNLLVYAFASEIVERMKIEPVREQIRRAMFRQMPGRLPDRRETPR